MDGYLSFLFISENTTFGNLVKSTTGSMWSHVGLLAFGGIVEAVPPRVMVSPVNRYAHCLVERVDFYVSDLKQATEVIKQLVGAPYGWLNCLKGGIKDVLDVTLPVRGNRAVNCCELAVRAIRGGGGVIAPDVADDCFTPQSFYTALKINVI